MAEFDVVIKDGMIIDGARNPRFRGDVGIKDGLIAEMGRISASDGDRVIDATGLNVAPGFIDLHTHYDSQVFWDPYCSMSGWHGVTSLVIGNCGFGFAPVAPENQERAMLSLSRNEAVPMASMREGMPWDWVSFPEFLDSVDRTPKSVNVQSYMPLTPLMIWVMGMERAKAGELPTDAEHAEMCRLLDEGIAAGGGGFSAQRAGVRSAQRDYDGTPMVTDIMHDETALALAKVLADRGDGIIQYSYVDMQALLSGDGSNIANVRRHIEEVAALSGRPVVDVVTSPDDVLWLQRCRARGLRIFGQTANVGQEDTGGRVFSVAESPQTLDFALAWCHATAGGLDEVRAKLADPGVRDKMRAELPLLEMLFGSIADWVLFRGASPDITPHDETRLVDVGAARGIPDLVDCFCEVNLADDLRTKWYFPARSGGAIGRETAKTMADDPFILLGSSDGGAHTKYQTGGDFTTRLLMCYVRDFAWLSLEEAHYRMSALPALCGGFHNRGVLRPGAAADVVVYDLDQLSMTDRVVAHDYPGNEWRLSNRGQGYRYVLVNGEVTIEDDAETGNHAGQLLRNGKASVPTPA